jgi:hypothetical protein
MSDNLVFAPRADQPTLPNPWMRLPPTVAALVANPRDWGTITPAADSQDLWKLIAAAAQEGRLQLSSPATIVASPALPALAPSEQSLPGWKQAAVSRCDSLPGQPVRSKVDLIALQAGILQMGDYLTPSHEHSQSIEGRGRRQAGDYWHAINHRREPDYGNAKYWFRHVGNHPLLTDLAKVIPDLAEKFSPSVQSKATGLIEGGRLDPFRFVDLISDACRRKDPELIQFAERLQWIEMVGLLESTLHDAVA